MLFDIRRLAWDAELCAMLGVDPARLPEPLPSSQVYGTTSEFGGDVPVAGIAGDQQAALFGQACTEAGMAKNTYGTGSFVLLNTGAEAPQPPEGLLTTVGWGIGERVDYALEAAIFRHRRRGAVAARRPRRDLRGRRDGGDGARLEGNDDVYFVPALDRARLASLGPLRARHDHRLTRGYAGATISPARRWRRWPTRRWTPWRRRRRASGRRLEVLKATAARGRQPLADAVPGRRARGTGRRPRGLRDDGAPAPPTWPESRPALDLRAGGGDVARIGPL
jgi:hypothetical protein